MSVAYDGGATSRLYRGGEVEVVVVGIASILGTGLRFGGVIVVMVSVYICIYDISTCIPFSHLVQD